MKRNRGSGRPKKRTVELTNNVSVTNYFLVNLSIADLLVTLLCMPSSAISAYSQIWYLGEVACKAGNFLQCISVAASVFTITAMALDRYMAITQPFGLAQCTCFDRKMAVLTIVFVWITSSIIFAPILYVRQLRSFDLPVDVVFCIENWDDMEDIYPRKVFGIVCFTVMFAIPGFLILWAYAMMGRRLCSVRPPFDNEEGSISTQQSFRIVRERKRVAWILLLLAFVFAICWLPYNAVNLIRDAGIHINVFCVHYLLLLGHANSAMNPIIYCIMSRNFRRSLKEMLCRRNTNFECRRNNRARWPVNTGSSQRFYLQKLYTTPHLISHPPHAHHTLTRLQSSQRTTKTCAV
ncbi:hypothetical protein Trydic_g23742 [Trypoxylus dichotomus]